MALPCISSVPLLRPEDPMLLRILYVILVVAAVIFLVNLIAGAA
jgi:hypothetical protein